MVIGHPLLLEHAGPVVSVEGRHGVVETAVAIAIEVALQAIGLLLPAMTTLVAMFCTATLLTCRLRLAVTVTGSRTAG